MSGRPRLLCYCQHSVGLGHLVRTLALCAGLNERFDVVLACGGSLPPGVVVPAGVELVALPPVGVGPDGRFGSQDPRYALDEAWALRLELLLATLSRARPQVVVTELWPFGRAKFGRELIPLLEAAAELRPAPIAVCSLRDILVGGRRDQQGHDDRAAELANRYFDAILIHADRRFATLEESFAPRTSLAVPVHYTGFILPNGHGAPPPPRRAEADRGLVVSAGGGRVGEPLLRAALGAHALLWPRRRLPTTLIGGPFLPEPAWEGLQRDAAGVPGLRLRRFVGDLTAELAGARASVSQCGYNTALELLRAGLPALVVPYMTPEEDEQLRRARRLQLHGALQLLEPDHLDAPPLAAAIDRLLRFQPRTLSLDVDGARRSAALLGSLVAARSGTAAAPVTHAEAQSA